MILDGATSIYLIHIVLFLGLFFDSLVGINFFVYGEIFLLSGFYFTEIGVLNFWAVYLFFVLAAMFGDGISFWLGRKTKNKVFFKKEGRIKKFLEKVSEKIEGVRHRNLYIFIFLSRFLGPISWVTPFIIGKKTNIKYLNFLVVSTLSIIFAVLQFYLFIFIGFSLYDLFLENIYYFIGVLFFIIIGVYYFQKKIFSKAQKYNYGKEKT